MAWLENYVRRAGGAEKNLQPLITRLLMMLQHAMYRM
jgi:hypothetical protein